MIYIGYTNGTRYNKQTFKTLTRAIRARRQITDFNNTPTLRIYRDIGDGVEQYHGSDNGREEWADFTPPKKMDISDA